MSYLNYFVSDCLKYIPSDKLPNKKVLVVGCGKGQDCSYFTEATLVHGLDICLNLGEDFCHPKVAYFKESTESMLRPDNFYDLVFSVATLEHVHDLDSAFQEIWRVTKPGGLIYTVAAPLWNCYQGHHLNYFGLFDNLPWFHLRLSQEELVEYIINNETIENLQSFIDHLNSESLLMFPLLVNNLKNYAENIANFLNSNYFNRLPAHKYVEIANQLDVSYLLRNDLWQDGEELLKLDIEKELEAKGLTKNELLSVSHTYVAIK